MVRPTAKCVAVRLHCAVATATLLWPVGCQEITVVDFNTPEVCRQGRGNITLFLSAQEECGKRCHLCVESTRDQRVVSYFVSHEDRCVCGSPERLTPLTSAADAAVASVAGDAGVQDAGRLADAGPKHAGGLASEGPKDAGGLADAGRAAAECLVGVGYVSRTLAEQACDQSGESCQACRQDGTSEQNATAWAVVRASCDCPAPSSEPVCAGYTGLTQREAETACKSSADCKVCVERVNFDNDPRGYLAHTCSCPDPYRLQ